MSDHDDTFKVLLKSAVPTSLVASFGIFMLAVSLKALLGHDVPTLEYSSAALGLWMGTGCLFVGVGLFALMLHDVYVRVAKNA